MSEAIARGLVFGSDSVRTMAENCADGRIVAPFEQLFQRYRSWTAQAELLYPPA